MTDQEYKRFYRSRRWRRLAQEILRRDHYQCQICVKRLRDAAESGTILTGDDRRIRRARIAHHIKPVEDYPDLRWDPDNLIAVCDRCHTRLHGRDFEGARLARERKTINAEKW